MNVLIVETVPKPANPIDAHVRNAIKITNFLKKQGHEVVLLFCNELAPVKKYDCILVSYATPYPSYKNIKAIFDENKDTPIGWLTNEYNLRPNGMFYAEFKKSNRTSFIIANYEQKAVKFACFDKFFMLNLNSLLYQPIALTEKKYDYIYYGTFRVGRVEYFKKYLQSDVMLSTSSKNMKKFKHIGCKPTFINKLDWRSNMLSKFRYSIYIEDEHTHSNFNHLANRFYESLANNCVLLFDKNCENTLRKSNLCHYERFIIDKHEDIFKHNKETFRNELEIQKEWVSNISCDNKKMLLDLESILKSVL